MQYIIVLLSIFGLDEFLKEKIEKGEMKEGDERKVGKALLIRKSYNKGAFLNFGEKNRGLVKIISIVFTLLITVLFMITLTQSGKGLLKMGLSLLLGGAYSNTYDRLRRQYVVDYVSFQVPLKGLRRVVFNIGDFGIMIGALLCLLGY